MGATHEQLSSSLRPSTTANPFESSARLCRVEVSLPQAGAHYWPALAWRGRPARKRKHPRSVAFPRTNCPPRPSSKFTRTIRFSFAPASPTSGRAPSSPPTGKLSRRTYVPFEAITTVISRRHGPYTGRRRYFRPSRPREPNIRKAGAYVYQALLDLASQSLVRALKINYQ